MTALRVLVTGGAGYIGSFVVRRLMAYGHDVVAYDSLATGHAWAIPERCLVRADLADRRLEELFAARRFEAVMHFAASIWVGESVREPARYYHNNTVLAHRLFDLAARAGVPAIVLSSSAAVYGQPEIDPIDEDQPLAPINPYGASKAMAERMLADIGAAHGMRHVALRYFNVAGAADDASLGEATPDNSHLIKVACQTACGLRPHFTLNGTDYPTPDGTCIRDYVHVEDLAAAHVASLEHLADGGASVALNCGYGHGLSVRAVLDALRRISGVDFAVEVGPRRPGDPASLVAANDRIRRVLGWSPRFDDLERIVGTAWRWEQALQAGRTPAGPQGADRAR